MNLWTWSAVLPEGRDIYLSPRDRMVVYCTHMRRDIRPVSLGPTRSRRSYGSTCIHDTRCCRDLIQVAQGIPMKPFSALALVFWLVATPGWAGVDEGIRAYNNGDYATAFGEFLSSAQQGNATAQEYLGVMYAKGQGVPQDYGQAIQWYQRAAQQGDASAQFNLGVMY